jgi:hypothetical protein
MRLRIFSITLAMVVLMVTSIASAQNQNPIELEQQCQIPKLGSGHFKLLFTSRGVTGEKPLILYILIETEKVNRGYLLKVAERINKTYCRENSIFVAIFDEKKYAGSFAVADFASRRNVYPGYRGQYSLNRQRLEETLHYSLKKGNPIDEVRIDLRK